MKVAGGQRAMMAGAAGLPVSGRTLVTREEVKRIDEWLKKRGGPNLSPWRSRRSLRTATGGKK